MSRLFNSITLLYAIMLIPAAPLVWGFVDPGGYYPQLMFDSGLWSIHFLIITIAVSPLRLIINRIGIFGPLARWLLIRRRHFGLASAIYAVIHLVHYFIDADSIGGLLADTVDLKITLGWLAFIIMALLAATSNNVSIRKLGRKWKTLHYWVYPAAALIFAHWYMFDFLTSRVIFWAGMFCAVKLAHGLIKLIPRKQSLRA